MLFRLDEGEFVKEVTWKDMLARLQESVCSTIDPFYTDKSFVPCFPKEAGAFPFCPQGMKKTVLLA